MPLSSLELLRKLAQVVYDKKGFNIIALDVRGLSSMTDYFLIAEGHVERHVIAMAKAIEDELSESGEKGVLIEGLESGDWVVIDGWEVVVHLFVPSLRQHYQLERVWQQAKLVELGLDTSEEAGEFAS